MPFQNCVNLLARGGGKAERWLAKGQNALLQAAAAHLPPPMPRGSPSQGEFPQLKPSTDTNPSPSLWVAVPGPVGEEEDGPVQSPRATFRFWGGKMLRKAVSEVQKLFNEKNLISLSFPAYKIPWVQHEQFPLLPQQRGLFILVLTVSFYRKSGVIIAVAHTGQTEERSALPSPAPTTAPLLRVGFAWATLSMAQVSQALG